MRKCSQNQINQVDFFTTVKTHKFNSVNNITLDQPKYASNDRPNRDIHLQCIKIVVKCLRPLSKNNKLKVLDLLRNAEESDDHEDVSYNVESSFTNISVKETIGYIIQKKIM